MIAPLFSALNVTAPAVAVVAEDSNFKESRRPTTTAPSGAGGGVAADAAGFDVDARRGRAEGASLSGSSACRAYIAGGTIAVMTAAITAAATNDLSASIRHPSLQRTP